MKIGLFKVTDPISEPLPLKLLVLSEFKFGEDGHDVAARTSDRILVDKDQFGEVIERIVGSLSLNVPNFLSDRPKVLSIAISITSIKSFHPDALIEAIPALKTLSGIRQLIARAMEGRMSSEECRRQLASFPGGDAILGRLTPEKKNSPFTLGYVVKSPTPPVAPSPSSGKSTDLESLLEMVDVPGASAFMQAPSTAHVLPRVESLIAQVLASGEGTITIDRKAAQTVLEEIDNKLAKHLDAILHHPEFQQVESFWRGMKFLVDRTNFRDPIQIDLLHLFKQDLASQFDALVVQPELSGHSAVPLTAILADYAFDRSPEDLALLDFLAHQAEQLQVPLITSVGLPFVGIESSEELRGFDDVGRLFDSVELVKWRALRQDPSSRWLVLAFNRFLLRYPYGSDRPLQAFPFQESVPSEDLYVWGNPIWAIGSVLTGSFSRSGWCTQLVGARGGGLIEDLPVREIQILGGGGGTTPLECVLSDAQRRDLSQAGILALTSPLQSDSALVLSAPTVHMAESYSDATVTDQARVQATLPYQLLAARIAHQVNQVRGGIGLGETHLSFQAELSRAISHALGLPSSDSCQAIIVKEEEPLNQTPDSPIAVTVYPDRLGLGNFPPIQLTLPAPK